MGVAAVRGSNDRTQVVKVAIGIGMAGKTFNLAIIVKANTKGAVKGLGGLRKTLGKLGVASAAMGAAAVTGVGLIGAAVTKLAVDAAPLEGIQAAFENLAEASGVSAQEMLANLKEGSHGMATQRDLMKTYNLAAQLVGEQFANELPNAMGYLGKVAAATGEDMGFMMDSLVRGVGRLSPMILDNLGIQVDLNKAYDDYARVLGKGAGELTKTEQQTALMNQVMEKLAENTANMPDVAGTAAQGIAALGVKFQDFKDTLGVAFLPVLGRVLDMLNVAADKYLPKIVAAFETAATVIEEFLSGAPGDFPWEDIFPPWLADAMYTVADWFESARDTMPGIIAEISAALEGGWPAIAEKLKEWGAHFWDWFKEDVIPYAKEKMSILAETFKEWAESSDTQAKLAEIGEIAGRGVVEGIRVLLGAEDTWGPIIIDMTGAFAKAVMTSAYPAFKAIAMGLAEGFVTGVSEAIGLKLPDAVKGAIARAMATIGLMGAIPGGGLLGLLPGFQGGGAMPGALGQPGLAMLHGGEKVTPVGGASEDTDLLRGILGAINSLAEGGHGMGLGDRASALFPS